MKPPNSGTISFLEMTPNCSHYLSRSVKIVDSSLNNLERTLDKTNSDLKDVEKINACIIQLKDLIWSLRNDESDH